MAWKSKGTPSCRATQASLRPVSSILSVGLNPGFGQSMPETKKEDRGHKFHSYGLTKTLKEAKL
jgi:hypothetical protein